ncbi:hypothetical protein IJ135_00020 [Candidatus Saccharibacteria bacterium]|nr:hypothetical protein [Candidatus Saccharibacteria bacterium]
MTDTYISNKGSVSGLTVNTSNKTLTLPSSSTSGFSNNGTAYVYNSSCTSKSSYCGYYSWIAATLGGKNESGAAVISDGYNAAASICPKGWKLPTATTQGVPSSNGGYTGGDLYKLAIQYGLSVGNPSEDPDNNPAFYTLAGPNTTPNFVIGAHYYYSTLYNDGGTYYASTAYSSSCAYILFFNTTFIYAPLGNTGSNWLNGRSVRCLFAG